MKENGKERASLKKSFLGMSFAALCSFMVVFSVVSVSVPQKAYAQTCETQAELSAAQALITALQDAAMNAVQSAVSTFVTNLINGVLGNLMPFLDTVDDTVRTELGNLWDEWLPGMEDMMKQLGTADIDKTRMFGSFFDAQDQVKQQTEISAAEIESTMKYRVSDEMCLVDTVNPTQLRARVRSTAMKKAQEREVYETGIGLGGMGMTGTIGAEGPQAALNAEFAEYMAFYKDNNLNAGLMPAGPASARAGDQMNVAKNIFGADTIDLTDQAKRQDIAVNTRLLMGRQYLPQFDDDVAETAQGRNAILERRKYQTRLNVYAGALGDVVGDRSPGEATPDLEAMQLANGRPVVEVSPNASYEEHKRARVQHLWTPRYINELNDAPHTAAQKQVDLYMMKTIELQDMTRKMERIGLIFSSRLGQRMDNMGGASAKNAMSR